MASYYRKGFGKLLRRNLITSALLIFVISVSIAGVTFAWVTDGSASISNIFRAGTIIVGLDPAPEASNPAETAINGCTEYKWSLKNAGTKSAYVRVTIEERIIVSKSETAWALGGELEDDYFDNYQLNGFKSHDIGNNWGWIFDYTVGDETIRELWAGAGNYNLNNGYHAGNIHLKTVIIEEDEDGLTEGDLPAGDYIKVTYALINGWTMSEAHLDVVTDSNFFSFPMAPGSFQYQEIFGLDAPVNEHIFMIPLTGDLAGAEVLYFAVHGVVSKDSIEVYDFQPSVLGGDCADNWYWHKEEDSPGYWYYWDDENDSLKKVASEGDFEFCLLICPQGSGYSHEQYEFKIIIEAIQTTHGAVEDWPHAIWQTLP